MSGARPGVYLAGFDVFLPDAAAQASGSRRWPPGTVLTACSRWTTRRRPAWPARRWQWIYRANVAMIQRADLVMANLNPFRGAEPDSGTAFEVATPSPAASRYGRTPCRRIR